MMTVLIHGIAKTVGALLLNVNHIPTVSGIGYQERFKCQMVGVIAIQTE